MSKTLVLPTMLVAALGVGLMAQTSGAPATGRSQSAGRTSQTPAPTTPALTPEQRWARASDAWNDGKYPDALRELKGLMQTVAAAEYHDRVALLTGELFTTIEITTDGRNPKISPNGQFVTYETGAGAQT